MKPSIYKYGSTNSETFGCGHHFNGLIDFFQSKKRKELLFWAMRYEVLHGHKYKTDNMTVHTFLPNWPL